MKTVLFSLLFFCTMAAQAAPTISAPDKAGIGSKVTVVVHGSTNVRDFLTIVPRGAAEGEYTDYQYIRDRSPIVLQMPASEGEYELRVCGAESPYPTLASQAIILKSVAASVTAPAQVDAGAQFEVQWSGPANSNDYVAIGSANQPYIHYEYARSGSPLTLKAPDAAGVYEIRYFLGQGDTLIATQSIIVGAVSASVSTPNQVKAGSTFRVEWSGPNHAQDFLTIVAEGAAEKTWATHVRAAEGSPVNMVAPDEPGKYELRYLTGQSYTTLARAAFAVTGVTGTFTAPAEIPAGNFVEVKWQGPDNPQNFITIVRPNAPDHSWGPFAYTRENPLLIQAPLEAGEYELRYSTAQSYHTLAKALLKVTPGEQRPGRVRVSATGENSIAAHAVEIILDASGSMLQKIGGVRRIDIARQTLSELTTKTIPAGTLFALRVFGREVNSCETQMDVPLNPLEPKTVAKKIAALIAKDGAKTPIGASLEKVADDLKGAKGEKLVIVLTDGEETCGGDPASAIQKLRASGVETRISIVGFAIEDKKLAATFRRWADAGGGFYFDARDGGSLNAAMANALKPTFEIFDAQNRSVASGVVDAEPVAVLPGKYQVRINGGQQEQQIEVVADTDITITF